MNAAPPGRGSAPAIVRRATVADLVPAAPVLRPAAEVLDALAALMRPWVEHLIHTYEQRPKKVQLTNGEIVSRYGTSAREAVKILSETGRARPPAPAAASQAWDEVTSRPSHFATLIERFGLDDTAARIVALLIALEHDAELEALCGYAWDDFNRPRPNAGFLVDLIGGDDPERLAAVRRALAADGPLRRYRLALVGAAGDLDNTPPPRRIVRLADRVITFLQGDPGSDPSLDGIAELAPRTSLSEVILPPMVIAVTERAVQQPNARVLLYGPAGTGKLMLIRALGDAFGRPVLRVNTGELLRSPERFEEVMARLAREAALQDAIVVFRSGRILDDINHSALFDRFVQLALRIRGPVVWSCQQRPSWLVHSILDLREVVFPSPPMHARVALWKQALGPDTRLVVGDAIEEIAGRFVLGGEPIHRAAERTSAQVRLRDPVTPQISIHDLTESARLMLQHRLGTVARRINPGFVWSDLLLPEDTMEGIREMLSFAKHRSFLLDEWGFDKKLPYGKGVSAILAGPPGTGKTMVAQLLAQELGYDLYLIELAQIVNKYIGETEKNLARVFDEAENSHAILFFDEADALFAKRTEVKSSNDRYANLEVNYLLQRMEAYGGITLLATNLEQGIDEAFKRRVRFSIAFELPEPPVRELLWKSMFPPQARLSPDINWKKLAERYEMAGAYIKKAALRGAARALDRGPGAEVTSADLELAAQLEYREMGRIA
jgi:SpoVK/Ycf46/Vps4 family AAA+-type ATPase